MKSATLCPRSWIFEKLKKVKYAMCEHIFKVVMVILNENIQNVTVLQLKIYVLSISRCAAKQFKSKICQKNNEELKFTLI
jgi:hypothetical protein